MIVISYLITYYKTTLSKEVIFKEKWKMLDTTTIKTRIK